MGGSRTVGRGRLSSLKFFPIIKMKLFILSCLIASSFALVHPKCKTEDGEIVFQHVVPGEPVCIDVVDTFCRPALKEEDSCKEVTRKACAPTDKVVDRPSGKIPEFYASDKICRLVPKATCDAHTVKVPKTTCEPIEAKFYHHFW